MTVFLLFKAYKKAVVFSLICHFFLPVQGQVTHSKRKENFDVHKFQVAPIHIAPCSGSLSLPNLGSITIIDARADTTYIGFMQKKIRTYLFFNSIDNAAANQAEQTINKTPTFVKIRNGCQNEASEIVKNYLVLGQNDSLPSILMIVKKLWLSDELNTIGDKHGSGMFRGTDSHDSWTSGIDVQMEFYLKDNAGYHPMYRYDSVISEAMTVSEYAPNFIAMALSLSLQKMRQMDMKINALKMRKPFTMEDIRSHLQTDFMLPILTDTVFKKGVYMTFAEFKDNSPSQMDFEVRKDKLTDNIYIKQPGMTDFAIRDIWGYSDGENVFVKSVNNFFVLQRSQNAFYIFGAKSITRDESRQNGLAAASSGNSMGTVPVTFSRTRTAIQLEPFQLDWSTGKLY